MKRMLTLAGTLLAAGLGLLVDNSVSFAQFSLLVQGPVAGGGGAFTGVGDTLSGAKAHWGVIAYNAANANSAITQAFNLCNVGDVVCADVPYVNGVVSSSETIGAITCGTGANLCTVKIAYDDSGANFCTSAACNLSQATSASRPTFVPNCIGTVPCLQFTSGQMLTTITNYNSTITLPSRLASASVPADPGTFSSILGLTASGNQIGVGSGLKPYYYDGNVLSQSGAISTATFYAFLGTPNGSGTGTLEVNGTSTTGSAGSNTDTSGFAWGAQGPGGGNPFIGKSLEAAAYNLTFSGGNFTALTSTMRTNGGF